MMTVSNNHSLILNLTKFSSTIFKIFFNCIYILLFLSCTKNKNIIIDNPSHQDIHVKINTNKQTYLVYGYDFLELKLPKGFHKIDITNAKDSALFQKNVAIQTDCIINPWLETYVVVFNTYSIEPNVSKQERSNITIKGNKYKFEEYKVIEKEYIIEKTWDYNLFETWADSLKYFTKKSQRKSKIYRLQDLEKEWGYLMDIDSTIKDIKIIDSELKKIRNKLKKF